MDKNVKLIKHTMAPTWKNHYVFFSNIFYSFMQWLHLNENFPEDSHAKILKLPSSESCSKYVPSLRVRIHNLTMFLFVIVLLLSLISLHSPTFVVLSHTCKSVFNFKDNLTFLRWPISFIMLNCGHKPKVRVVTKRRL